ncbi:MAG: hypothetical protein OQK48_08195 [Sulfurimonas sp.]|uniref:hypothetical protein n=1 Tax=Sulfurimonas sp. TaxID=2022749 RepID=UPI002614C487|nr:hypothetical protein [Sulfurimonas sp.]MCW8895894.1 hypothetical protein [Sulfurimonas sp.]MCW8954912.1 hypothetical protein [Sulfurimonas sp.]MCW9067578.1 hypothetical protein [Sulfurimonas sp.]
MPISFETGLIFIVFSFMAFSFIVFHKRNKIKRKAWEEKIYKQVVVDLEKDEKRAGLWALAKAESNGSEDICKSLYIKYCTQSIIGEHEILNTIRL